jgi:hypothetical protein
MGVVQDRRGGTERAGSVPFYASLASVRIHDSEPGAYMFLNQDWVIFAEARTMQSQLHHLHSKNSIPLDTLQMSLFLERNFAATPPMPLNVRLQFPLCCNP